MQIMQKRLKMDRCSISAGRDEEWSDINLKAISRNKTKYYMYLDSLSLSSLSLLSLTLSLSLQCQPIPIKNTGSRDISNLKMFIFRNKQNEALDNWSD